MVSHKPRVTFFLLGSCEKKTKGKKCRNSLLFERKASKENLASFSARNCRFADLQKLHLLTVNLARETQSYLIVHFFKAIDKDGWFTYIVEQPKCNLIFFWNELSKFSGPKVTDNNFPFNLKSVLVKYFFLPTNTNSGNKPTFAESSIIIESIFFSFFFIRFGLIPCCRV